MREVDYIVVGLGIAGISVCEHLDRLGRSVVVFDDTSMTASRVAAGIINPTVLKRFTPVWNAEEHIHKANSFYKTLGSKFDVSLLNPVPILRVFNSVEEQNNWMVASDRQDMKEYLSPQIIPNDFDSVIAPFGFGKVLMSARVDTGLLIDSYKEKLAALSSLKEERFDHDQLSSVDGSWHYGDIKAKRIIFTEGALVRNNPYFPTDWLIPNKGDYLIIKAPDLKITQVIKGPVFIVPLGDDLYKVGATFDKGNDQPLPDPVKRAEIEAALDRIISCSYQVVNHIAGVRPTTKDRRPLLGSLPGHPNSYFMAGMGTRGIMAAPSMGDLLINHIENGTPLPKELDINRFS